VRRADDVSNGFEYLRAGACVGFCEKINQRCKLRLGEISQVCRGLLLRYLLRSWRKTFIFQGNSRII
jgi:hypothetical protein